MIGQSQGLRLRVRSSRLWLGLNFRWAATVILQRDTMLSWHLPLRNLKTSARWLPPALEKQLTLLIFDELEAFQGGRH